ncbi:exodeoxyribonuclease III [Magnetovibrio sp. PR-2]|uniref:exodeoxyribonuclease III n=1 Tax=Magnetovibrio sp. PR-2 TaxID=3120356 RepID=UPI002FCE10A0
MKIATWNVNSLKARQEHLIKWLGEFEPDVVLLQELKGVEEKFPMMEVNAAGYEAAVVGQKTYNGVAILSKTPIEVTATRLPGEEEDVQARYVEGIVQGVRLGCIYLPNGNPTPGEKYDYKIRWMRRLYAHARELLKTEEPFVLGGDYNVIPEPQDVHDPSKWTRDALYLPESRNALRCIVNLGLTDAFRACNAEGGRYSWWDYRAGSWDRDEGCRIDHLLLSPQAADKLSASGIDKTPRGWEKPSDHTPVWCALSL